MSLPYHRRPIALWCKAFEASRHNGRPGLRFACGFMIHRVLTACFTALWQRFLALRLLLLLAAASSGAAHAQFRVEIGGVGATQVPVAVAPFRQTVATEERVSDIIRNDLEMGGAIRLIEANQGMDELQVPVFSQWKAKAADGLLTGSVTAVPDGKLVVRTRLWDVVRAQEWGNLTLTIEPQQLRAAAHAISDFVHKTLTGEEGVYSTKVAWVGKEFGRYTVWVADWDGYGATSVLTSAEPIMSLAWSPDGKELAYVSFEDRKAVVFVQTLSTGARRVLANFKGSNSAPAWSPDGQRLALTLSREGGSQIYLIDRYGGEPRRFTRSAGIDTEAVFSPDGQWLYFVSDRGGSPQIYRQALDSSEAERITFNGGFNVSPTLSTDGQKMAYVNREAGNFKLMLMNLSNKDAPISLTETGDDERPRFAPNNRVIIYGTRLLGRGVVMVTSIDGRAKTRITPHGADVRDPIWGPWVR